MPEQLEAASGRSLVLLAIAGDDAAFQELVLRHQSRVRGFLRRLCADAALADDLAQTVFLKAWRNLDTLRDADAFPSWLMRIAARSATDTLRLSRPAAAPLDDGTAGAPLAAADGADARLDIEAALARLSAPARACILLFHGEGLTHAEIAAETGMPLGTVKSHIARATVLLRGLLKGWRPRHA